MSDEHVDIIREIVEKYNSNSECSVRLDTSCQTAEGRYEIFRSDGNLYSSWEAFEPKEYDVPIDPDLDKDGGEKNES